MLRAHCWVALLLSAVLGALTTLAYASPPDPTYVGGLWDDDDYDDVVILATSATSVVDMHAGCGLAVVRVVIGALSPACDTHIPLSRLCIRPSRAPPIA